MAEYKRVKAEQGGDEGEGEEDGEGDEDGGSDAGDDN
jgi:hypothetical protein